MFTITEVPSMRADGSTETIRELRETIEPSIAPLTLTVSLLF